MGPELHHKYGIPYAIDYQDPWVQKDLQCNPWWHRSRWTARISKWLEPRALKDVAFLSAINEAYMEGPLMRHPHLHSLPNVAIQLGFSERDHTIPMPQIRSPWAHDEPVLLYAGTYWEQGAPLFEDVLQAWSLAAERRSLPPKARLVFIGTGHPDLPVITDRAADLGIVEQVTEIKERIPFLEVQELLRRATATLVIGSTSKHYSASKVFQLLVAQRPIIAHLHPESEAGQILRACQADQFLSHYDSRRNQLRVEALSTAISQALNSTNWSPDLAALTPYSASNACKRLLSSFESSLSS